ncbi:uncharacterized protein LOC135843482 [Planococcus citri]|uniref:uncharacterized protein LOC135843482 n=1 Tax=Planococcus citri TaxID=170843 RepID=UPI0031F889D4
MAPANENYDNFFERYDFYDYRPPSSENINQPGGEIPITVYNEDIITLPCESRLVFTGQISVNTVATDGTATAVTNIDTSKIDFDLNGILHRFEFIEYKVGEHKVDDIRKPGISTTMKGLASFRPNMAQSLSGWNIYQGAKSLINSSGYFTIIKPLSELMGCFEDYRKCLVRVPQTLIFHISTSSDNNCFYSKEGTKYQVSFKFTDIIWRMRHIKLRIDKEAKLRKEVLTSTNYTMHFRHWLYQSTTIPVGTTEYTWDVPVSHSKVKYAIIAFQKDVVGKLDKQMGRFDLLNVENVQLEINNYLLYPKDRLNLKYAENKCGNIFEMFKAFPKSYYNRPEEDPVCDYITFLTDFPMIIIDCSHQPEVIKDSLINTKIHFNFRSDGFPDKGMVHLLMIMDCKAVYNPLNNQVIT